MEVGIFGFNNAANYCVEDNSPSKSEIARMCPSNIKANCGNQDVITAFSEA